MKYIRTENRIYEIDNSRSETSVCYFTTNGWVYKKDVIKTADTIEDLCDEFVVKENSSHKPILLDKIVDFDENNKKYYVKGEYGFNGIVYTLKELMVEYKEMSIKGAIYTYAGLIYVAKMNREKFEIINIANIKLY